MATRPRRQAEKDRFIDLAQAALEDADQEEDRKGVIQEVIETLIAKLGANLVSEVVSEQLRSQEVIERLAENHDARRRRRTSPEGVIAPNILKEPDFVEERTAEPVVEPMILVSEYLWRLFRVLLFASLVALVYRFVCAQVY